MAHAHGIALPPAHRVPRPKKGPRLSQAGGRERVDLFADPVTAAFQAGDGIAKPVASRLFESIAAVVPRAPGKLRAELIPDSSWKRAPKILGPQASQTTARLGYVLGFAERVWGNHADAVEWLLGPHPELKSASPYSMLKTEAGGRAVESLLAALEYGFPV